MNTRCSPTNKLKLSNLTCCVSARSVRSGVGGDRDTILRRWFAVFKGAHENGVPLVNTVARKEIRRRMGQTRRACRLAGKWKSIFGYVRASSCSEQEELLHFPFTLRSIYTGALVARLIGAPESGMGPPSLRRLLTSSGGQRRIRGMGERFCSVAGPSKVQL